MDPGSTGTVTDRPLIPIAVTALLVFSAPLVGAVGAATGTGPAERPTAGADPAPADRGATPDRSVADADRSGTAELATTDADRSGMAEPPTTDADRSGTTEPATDADANRSGSTAADDCAPVSTSAPPDPPNDTLGWENGCWANETLAVTRSDGLDATERRAVLSRAMARVERIRGLEFRRDVTLEIDDSFAGGGQRRIPRRNLKYEALFMLGEDEYYADAVGPSNPPGYAVDGGRLVRVANDTRRPDLPAHFLAHELAHVLQHQHVRDGEERTLGLTIDERAARDAVVEGAAQYVQHRYERRCTGDWQCGSVDRPNFTDVHPGLFGLTAFPYMDGMAFVHRIHERGNWTAVNDLHEAPPASSEQVIHPGKYPDDAPATPDVTVEDRSTGTWQPVELLGGKRHESAGEVGIFLLFAYATWDDATDGVAVDRRPFVNRHDVRPAPFDPYNYSHPWSDGWEGDRMVFYNELSTDLNETGYVWKTRWESEADARQFRRGYRRVLELRGARAVDDRPDTWRIPDDRRFGDAFSLARNGTAVVVVNAPTVEQLSDVRERTGPDRTTPSTTPGSTTPRTPTATPAGPTPTAGSGSPTPRTPTAGTPSPTGTPDAPSGTAPGFTALGALVAVAVLSVLAWRRRRQ